MAKIISLTLNKGGVSKSTSTAYLGSALARQGHKVLLIDLDSQRNCTDCFPSKTYDNVRHIGKVLLGQMKAREAIFHLRENLDIIPSHTDLLKDEEIVANYPRRDDVLKKALKPIRDEYDFILLDTPPHIGLATYNALYASDLYMVPVTAEVFSYAGVDKIVKAANVVAEDTDLKLAGVFISRYNPKEKGNAVQAIAQVIKETEAYKTFNTYIRQSKYIKEAQIEHKDVFDYAPESTAVEDYTKLATELLERYG